MKPPKKWAITGYVAIGIAVILVAIFGIQGWNESAFRLGVRTTARMACTLFLLAFVASSLRRVWPAPFTTWLLRNRRYVGVSFAVVHFVHLALLVVLGFTFPDPFIEDLNPVQLVGGGLAYAFIAAMTATSFDRAVHWMGARRWKRLHTIGSYYIWIVFAQANLKRTPDDSFYVLFAIPILLALMLRLYVHFRPKKSKARLMQSSAR